MAIERTGTVSEHATLAVSGSGSFLSVPADAVSAILTISGWWAGDSLTRFSDATLTLEGATTEVFTYLHGHKDADGNMAGVFWIPDVTALANAAAEFVWLWGGSGAFGDGGEVRIAFLTGTEAAEVLDTFDGNVYNQVTPPATLELGLLGTATGDYAFGAIYGQPTSNTFSATGWSIANGNVYNAAYGGMAEVAASGDVDADVTVSGGNISNYLVAAGVVLTSGAVQSLAPDSTVSTNDWTNEGGAASLHAALADESDATYAQAAVAAVSPSTTGEVYAGSAETIAESPWLDNTWLNPTNATGAPNGTMASITDATYDSGDQSFVLKAYNYGFSLPAGATIVGVRVKVKAAREMAGAGAIGLVQLLNTSRAKVGDNKAATEVAITATGAEYTFGGPTDLWGNALTEAWVEDADFGVALGFWARAANTDVEFDAVSIEVFYTDPSVVNSSGQHRGTVANPAATPGAGPVTLRFRAQRLSGPTTQVLRVTAYEGATQRATQDFTSMATSFQDYSLNVPGVVNANDLEYAIENRNTDAVNPTTMRVSRLRIEVPEGAAGTPISGTDTNGATTEAATVVSTYPVTDANSTTTEAVTLAATAAGSDVNGAKTETGTPNAAIAGADVNGATTESGNAQVGTEQKNGTDASGTTTDAGALAAALPGADASGATTESGTYRTDKAGADVGAASDTGALAATAQGSDVSGATTEAGADSASVPGSDSNATTTEVGVSSAGDLKNGSDTNGAPTESGAVLYAPAGTDASGGSSETATYAAPVSGADASGGAVEAATVSVPVAGTDVSGPSTENTTLSAALSGAESLSPASEVGGLTAADKGGQDASGPTTEQGSANTEDDKAGSDVNGTASESALRNAAVQGFDANALTTESATFSTFKVGDDHNGVSTEVGTAAFDQTKAGADSSGPVVEGAVVKIRLSTTGGPVSGRYVIPDTKRPVPPELLIPGRLYIYATDTISRWTIKEFASVDPPSTERQLRAEEEAILLMLP